MATDEHDHEHTTEDIWLGILLVFMTGLMIAFGGCISFMIPRRYSQVLPISLAFSAGVLIYLSFIEVFPATEEGFDTTGEEEWIVHIYTSLTFFGGILIGGLLDQIVHKLGHEHDHHHMHHSPQTKAATAAEARRIANESDVAANDIVSNIDEDILTSKIMANENNSNNDATTPSIDDNVGESDSLKKENGKNNNNNINNKSDSLMIGHVNSGDSHMGGDSPLSDNDEKHNNSHNGNGINNDNNNNNNRLATEMTSMRGKKRQEAQEAQQQHKQNVASQSLSASPTKMTYKHENNENEDNKNLDRSSPYDSHHHDDGHHDKHHDHDNHDHRGHVGELSAFEEKHLMRVSLTTAVAVSLHNLPEGLATFIGTIADPAIGFSIAIAVAIHNIPLGISIATPVYVVTRNKSKAIGVACIAGLTQPLGGLIGLIFIESGVSDVSFSIMFGLTGGLMIYTCFRELLPAARFQDPSDQYTSWLVFIGMIVLDVSLILFDSTGTHEHRRR